MDSQALTSLIIAAIAIIPGIWALVNQAAKDKKQAQIDQQNAAQNAAIGIIQPLRDENARLQQRNAELEKMLVDERAKSVGLNDQLFERDKTIQKLQYNLEGMALKMALDLDESDAKEEVKKEAPKEPTKPRKTPPKKVAVKLVEDPLPQETNE